MTKLKKKNIGTGKGHRSEDLIKRESSVSPTSLSQSEFCEFESYWFNKILQKCLLAKICKRSVHHFI